MASSATVRKAIARKPLGIRATPEEQEIIRRAAEREHRSINSFVVRAALAAAERPAPERRRTPEEVQAAVERAQAWMRQYRKPGESLVDELIAERRLEAADEPR